MAESRENDMEANRAARDAVAADGDTRREIRDIVTRTVAGRRLAPDSLRHVLKLVLDGAAEGMPANSGAAAAAMRQAGEGIEDAMKRIAEAWGLAIEEARSRGDDFTEHDLKRATDDLMALDRLFIDTMRDFSKAGATAAQSAIGDLATHVERSGGIAATAIRDAAETLGRGVAASGRPHSSDLNRAARAGMGTIAALGSAILGGIAEGLAAAERPPAACGTKKDG